MRTHRKALQDRFVDAVRAGIKTSTIRPPGRPSKRPMEGDTITLFRWTGRPYHSKQQEVGRFRVRRVWNVTVSEQGTERTDGGTFSRSHAPGGERETIAQREGFRDWEEMASWFRDQHGLPFDGIMIEWEEL